LVALGLNSFNQLIKSKWTNYRNELGNLTKLPRITTLDELWQIAFHANKSINGKGQLDEKSYKYNCKKIEEKLFTDKQKSEKRKKKVQQHN